MQVERHIVIRDSWGAAMAHCSGPTPDGRCPRAAFGAVVPSAGRSVAVDTAGRTVAYAGPEQEVSCPVTVALAMATSPDSGRVA